MQQTVMKNKQTQMKTTQHKLDLENKEEERSDGGFYTNSHVYVNSVGDKRLLSSDRALEDEVVYANT